MYLIKTATIQQAYKKLIKTLLRQKTAVGTTYELNNCCIELSKPSIADYWLPFRQISKDYLEAELRWYWSGSNSCEEIGKHAKMWLSLTDDGVTSNSAYGYIIQRKYDFDQLQQIIKLLKNDKDSRRAVINISDPAINRIKTHDMQCTVAIQFLVRNGCLEETVYMRSNDVYFGLPYDYYYFMTIGLYVAKRLNLTLSKYTHHATSMHMYLKDLPKFKSAKAEKYSIDLDYVQIIKDCYSKRRKQ